MDPAARHYTTKSAWVTTLTLGRRRNLLPLLYVALMANAARADPGDDALRYYLSKASLVVSGEILDTPQEMASLGDPVYRHSIHLRVAKVMKGGIGRGAEDSELRVILTHLAAITRPEEVKETRLRLPFLQKGKRVILFLRKEKSSPWHETVDPWFGIQPANKFMERALARLADAPAFDGGKELEKDGLGAQTLRFYKSKASLVVSGEISEISPATYADDSTSTRFLRVKVTRIMRGGVQGDEIEASVVRFEDKSNEPPFLRKGGRVILFLRQRNGEPRYETVDPWFGVQQFNSVMEREIDEVQSM